MNTTPALDAEHPSDDARRFAPELHDAVMGFRTAPRTRDALSPKTRQLVLLALYASACTMHHPGIRRHVDGALAAGATTAEIADTLATVAPLGVHTFAVAVPVLLEVLAESGAETEAPEIEAGAAAIKADFLASRGYWTEQREMLARFLPEYFRAYMKLSAAPWKSGPLDDITRELLCVAIDCSVAHMYVAGIRIHARNALAYGATRDQLLAVFELASTIGTDAYLYGMDCVAEAVSVNPAPDIDTQEDTVGADYAATRRLGDDG